MASSLLTSSILLILIGLTFSLSLAKKHSPSSNFLSGSPSINLVSNGLTNLGNTCFLNSQLECAFHIPIVRNILQEEANNINDSQIDPSLSAMEHLFSEMESSANRLGGGFGRPSNTRSFCSTLGISVYEQQDTQEFWKLLLPELDNIKLLDLYKGNYEDYIQEVGGEQRKKIIKDFFVDLSLEVGSGSVSKALKSKFQNYERLSVKGGNGWKPDKQSGERVDANKGSHLKASGLPPLLQLHLKRFNFDWNTETTDKINDRFSFPKVLDLAKFVQKPNDSENNDAADDLKFVLQSIVIHQGKFGSGHYYAYVRPNIESKTWYRFDDDRVTKVSFRDVKTDAFGGAAKQKNKKEPPKGFGGPWGFFFGRGRGGDFGWGGRDSSAYMVQYVRQRDIPRLYGLKSYKS